MARLFPSVCSGIIMSSKMVLKLAMKVESGVSTTL